MNISELARKLNVPVTELRERLPGLGFDIGLRAIKVDDRVAQKIIQSWAEWKRAQRVPTGVGTEKQTPAASGEEAKEETAAPPIALPSAITVRDFATALGLPVTRVIQELMKSGVLAAMNERIDYDTAAIVAEDLGFRTERRQKESADESVEMSRGERLAALLAESPEKLQPRAPVVVIMGHVDHGKTKLLDAIRETDVASGEAGGITQHIGAYQVTQKKGKKITFIDTPGHEAFTVMRSRGARVADVAVLVVAADDGVQPQTVEAKNIIEAAKLPFVVALNKMDKADVNTDLVKRQLSDIGLLPEDWGGKTVIVPVSAKTGQGIPELLDMILLVAEVEKESIMANPERRAVGTIIESHMDKLSGVTTTVLVQAGTLHANDHLAVAGKLYGRVRAMNDWNGKLVKEAGPGMPVRILGCRVAPQVGDILEVPEDPSALERIKPSVKGLEEAAPRPRPLTEEEAKVEKRLAVLLRADVLGSLEAIVGSFEKFVHPEVAVDVVGRGLGNITEADVSQAEASGAQVLGFHVQPMPQAATLAAERGVKIRVFEVIYDLLNAVRADLEHLLPPEVLRAELGKVKVKGVFRTERRAMIVGGLVTEGKVLLPSRVRIIRNGETVDQGALSELQVAKHAATEAAFGQECGLRVETRTPILLDDVLEFFTEETKTRKITFSV